MLNEPNSRSTRNHVQGFDLETPFVDFGKLSESHEQFETALHENRSRPPIEASLAELTPFDNEVSPQAIARFQIAFEITMKKEGGHSKNSADYGGETYRGIARNFHKTWAGWAIIETAKQQPDFPRSLETNQPLQALVADFYRAEFWNKVRAGEIYSQAIANELFDSAVHLGHTPALEILQRALNYITEPGQPLLTHDGKIGPATISAVNRWLGSSSLEPRVAANSLLGILLALRARYYLDRIDKSECKKCFFEGWIRRILGKPDLEFRRV